MNMTQEERRKILIEKILKKLDSSYEKVKNYPYSRLIDYNGIRSIDVIEKIK